MVNEPMSWQLQVDDLRTALDQMHPGAVVLLNLTSDDIRSIAELAPTELSVGFNLRVRAGNEGGPCFVLTLGGPPAQG